MAFHGVFIGVDRYASPSINWLSCAKRDAVALEALFGDTLGGTTTLLADEHATRVGIETALQRLTSCDPDDTVVISFSGHGSESHELITYDADQYDLPRTAIPLDELTTWFGRIPVKRLILLLDCCFSGGMGAKGAGRAAPSRVRGSKAGADVRRGATHHDCLGRQRTGLGEPAHWPRLFHPLFA